MKTWLDCYAYELQRTALVGALDFPGLDERTLARYRTEMSKSPAHALSVVQGYCGARLIQAMEDGSINFSMSELWTGYTFGLLAPAKDQATKQAIALTRSSAEAIKDAAADYHDEIRDILAPYFVTYIDVPPNAYPIGNGTYGLRAIAAVNVKLPSTGELPNYRGYVAVLASSDDHEKVRFFTWADSRAREHGSTALPSNVSIELFDHPFASVRSFCRPLEDFMCLSLQYHEQLKSDPEAGIVDIPRKNDRASKTAFQREHPSAFMPESLFKISYLSSVKRGSYSPRGTEKGKRTPYRRHEVPGFWRRQAYGPGWKLRRDVWVEGFQRGHGELVSKTAMSKVTAVNSDTLDGVMA